MAGEQKVEVVARGKFWAIVEDDDGVVHKMFIETGRGKSLMNWACRGMAKIVNSEALSKRVCNAPVTCIDCIAKGLS